MTKINDPNSVTATKVFGMELAYGNTADSYNGNISSMSWQTRVPTGLGLSQQLQSYSYTYDKLNRLTSAAYNSSGATDKFNEELSYDEMGNILTLKRKNVTTANTCLNNLTYNYTNAGVKSNRLLGVSDAGMAAQTSNYTYDDNGNQKTDSRKGISISYNHLNLPQTITKASTSETMSYVYDGTGRRLRKVVGTNNRDYIDGIEYNNGSIEFIQTEEGRAIPGTTYTYEYLLKDHLGNTRAGVKQDGSTVQVQDYYAFGMEMNPGNMFSSSPVNQYKYNGKEKQNELGLEEYDYGARFYDPLVAKFTTIDPLAANFTWMTPYQYASNDPIKNIDLDGLEGLFFQFNPGFLTFGNSSVTPRIGPIAEVARLAPENIVKAGGELSGKQIIEVAGRTVETAAKSNEHHIIPRQFKGNDVIEAAREGGFKFEGKENKMTIEQYSKSTGEGQHGNHPSYNKGIGEKLMDFANKNPEYTTADALKFVRGLVDNLKQTITNSPATKINDLLKLPAQDGTKVVIQPMLPANPPERQFRMN